MIPQQPAADVGVVRAEFFAPRLEHFCGNVEIYASVGNVYFYGVAVGNERDLAALRRLGTYVPYRRAARRARKSAVGDERNVFIETHAYERGSGREHFAHARSARRSFVANDHDVAFFDLAVVYGDHRVLFAIEALGFAREREHVFIDGGTLDERAALGERAFEYGDTADGGDRIVYLAYDALVLDVRVLVIVRERAAVNGLRRAVYEIVFGKLVQHRRHAAREVELLHIDVGGRRELTQSGRSVGNGLHVVERELNIAFRGYREKVQNRVSGRAERHVERERVCKGALGHYHTRRYRFAHETAYGKPRFFCKAYAFARGGEGGAVVRQRHAERFAQTVYRVCGVHAAAAAAAGAGDAFQLVKLRTAHIAFFDRAYALEHGRQTYALAFEYAAFHGSARYEDRRDIYARRAHEHAGYYLIAIGHEYRAVERVSAQHRFHAVGDKLARGQGVAHAVVTHGKTVANAYARNYYGRASARVYAGLYGVGYRVEVHVTGNYFGLCRHYGDERLCDLLVGKP